MLNSSAELKVEDEYLTLKASTQIEKVRFSCSQQKANSLSAGSIKEVGGNGVPGITGSFGSGCCNQHLLPLDQLAWGSSRPSCTLKK